ncbi:MAG: hypothetical protein E7638_07400, partial [Ruminococcaceae bacterium]|nr:hypothetical protein [Oscillospiraceae bacterium]
MKTIMKRFLLAGLAASMTLGAVSCGRGSANESDTSADTASPDTELPETAAPEAEPSRGMKKFEITFYGGLYGDNMVDEHFYQMIVDCGFTTIPLENNGTEQNKAALELFRKYGLTCSALMDPRIIDASAGNDSQVFPDTPAEEIDRIVAEVVADYADYMDVIDGWWVQDEPNSGKFDVLGKLVSAFRRYSPDENTMINLFPCWPNWAWGEDTYDEYLDEFVAQVNPHYLSYDNYHFYDG